MPAGARNISRHQAVAINKRPLLTLLCILALFFQTYVAQTHIHIPLARDAAAYTQNAVAADANKIRLPFQTPQDDESKCPLCQVAVAAGMMLGPLVYYLVPPSESGLVQPQQEFRQPVALAPAHVWNSRGPPRR